MGSYDYGRRIEVKEPKLTAYGSLKQVLTLVEEVEDARKVLNEKEQQLESAIATLDPSTKQILNSIVSKISTHEEGQKQR